MSYEHFPLTPIHVRVLCAETGAQLQSFGATLESLFQAAGGTLVLATDLEELPADERTGVLLGLTTIHMTDSATGWRLETAPGTAKLIDPYFWYGQEESDAVFSGEPLLVVKGFWWPLVGDSLLDEVLA